ncbi:MAG: type VII secretion protein EssC [Clostridia bacterium]|nr:type VII secretion protein EssC [Clostridia bacterium]
MLLNLIKPNRIFSLTLPSKIKGLYWLADYDDKGAVRELLSVEAIGSDWVAKSNKYITILDSQNNAVSTAVIRPNVFYNVRVAGANNRTLLFAESMDSSRNTFTKFFVRGASALTIGRTNDNIICYENMYVSSKHALLKYDSQGWSIVDTESTNGTYVNGSRVESTELAPGDVVYIMGLRIIIGKNYFAVNNPDNTIRIGSRGLVPYMPQSAIEDTPPFELPEKEFFFRSPRFHREIERARFKIDPPPQHQKTDSVPTALMLGPSLTMGVTSLSTGILGVHNVINNGGNVTQALPTLMMSGSMLLGTVLWPILSKKYEKKQRIIGEGKRQKKYLAYLDKVRDEIRRESKTQSDILNENLISLGDCADRIVNKKTSLWERSIGQSDFLRIRLGTGDLPLDAECTFSEKTFTMDDDTLQDAMLSLGKEPKMLRDVPVSLSLVDIVSLGIYGEEDKRNTLLKSLILQTVALHSYDDVKILMLVNEENAEEWTFIRPLQYIWNDDKSARFFATTEAEVKDLSAFIEREILARTDNENFDYSENAPYYILISTSKELTDKCHVLAQMLKLKFNVGFSIIMSVDELRDLPKDTKYVVSLEGDSARFFSKDDTSGNSIVFSLDRLNESAMEGLSQALSNIELDKGAQRFLLPNMLTFLEMFNVSKIEHLNSLTRWKENNPTISLQTPVGVDTFGGLFNLDLHEKYHGPHGLVAGMTGSGKSEFIITYILSLAVNYHPDEVAFILIDYKGGGLTGAFEDEERGVKLPHLAGTITNLDGAAINRSLISIQSELRRRQQVFNNARKISNEGTMDIYKYQKLYRDKVVSEPVPHLFIISDEFAELKSQQPEFMQQLISAARIGRSLGVHLILATQKPSGVVDDQIWSNSKFRVCLKVQEKADSMDMIKCADAAEISQTGRFYLQVGFNELFALGQSAWCGAEYIPTESVETHLDDSIQVVDNLGRVLANYKPSKKRGSGSTKLKQIVAIVKYLSDLAVEERVSVRPLWLDPIPAVIFVDDIEKKYNHLSKSFVLDPVIGEYDDPFNQRQAVLTVPLSRDGNCLVYGSTGNGKTTFLTSLCYSLIKNHSPEEVNVYIMDFGSETLKVFEQAPQVGGVVLSADIEKTINFLKMLKKEVEQRRASFSEFGGDYASYIKNSGKTLPNIVVLLNNYSVFSELYEDYLDDFTVLTRDGSKYGIYFVLTAGSTNAVRYRVQQNFKTMISLQLNDATEYVSVVGRTEGVIPSKYKGRGLVSMGKVYEFQTAYCAPEDGQQDFLRGFCGELNNKFDQYAANIPILPEYVNLNSVRQFAGNLNNVPVGIGKKNLTVATVNIAGKVAFPVAIQELGEAVSFVEELYRVLNSSCKTVIVDAEQQLTEFENRDKVSGNFENFVQELFDEMVKRNNDYKDENMDLSVLDDREEITYIVIGISRLFEQLSEDRKDKLATLIEKAEPYYKIHFVIVDYASKYSEFAYSAWYKRHISGIDGLWLGDGVADQFVIKLSKTPRELYQDVGSEYGYIIVRGKHTLIKLLSSNEEEVE